MNIAIYRTFTAWTLIVLFVSVIGLTQAAEPAPLLLPFQAYLTGSDGKVLEDGVRTVQFKVYDSPIGGESVWAGEVHRLSINGGLINTILGTQVEIPRLYGENVPTFSRPHYLEITVDGDGNKVIDSADPPLLPRQVILPSVFASSAGDAQTLKGFDWSEILIGRAENPGLTRIDGARIGVGTIEFPILATDLQKRINDLETKVNELEGLTGLMRNQFNFEIVGADEVLDLSGVAGYDYHSRGGRLMVMVSIASRATNVSEGGNVTIEFDISINDANGAVIASTKASHWYAHQSRLSSHTFPSAMLTVPALGDSQNLKIRVARTSPAEGEQHFGASQRISVAVIEFPSF